MPFPEARRVIFHRNPLRQVICQVRFPPILRIDAEIPASFQERIRKSFPNFAETSEVTMEVPPGVQVPPEMLRQALQSTGIRNYEFTSEDENWKLNLTRTFVALSTTAYRRWEEFRERLNEPLNALVHEYSPTHFSRIGLRYIDVIKPSELGLAGVTWGELLQPYVLGVLGSPDVGGHIKDFENRYEISLADGRSLVRLVTRFVDEKDERCYMIDSDFFNTDRTEIDHGFDILDYFNVRSSRLIQWVITKRLYEAMEPEVL
jgi:uncharacterized protein (TIGR04255 family)